jgi:DNA topoisomerase-3
MRLVVAEKPSVARDLAAVVGRFRGGDGCLVSDDVVITWCVGHLVELEDPAHYDPSWKAWRLDTLPMLPAQFALRPREGARDQWAVVKRLLKDKAVHEVVNACDAGREGEHIFRTCYEAAGCKKPVLRFWASSLTDDAIRTAWSRLVPADRYDGLADAARCRAEADWLVGLNATRALTCLTREGGGDALWSLGRVQTPTLAMIAARDRAIASFVPEAYWTVSAEVEAVVDGTAARWKATWVRAEGLAEGGKRAKEAGEGEPEGDPEAPNAERLGSEDEAHQVVAALRGGRGTVHKADRTRRTERPPLLYDLTALQRRANQRYGLSAAQTLEIAQALYERHKLITYPRTDARYLTEDQVPELPGVLRGVAAVPVYRPFCEAILAKPIRPGKRVVDDAEVGDHHAILPTGRAPDGARLTADEKRVYDLVVRRLLAALSPDAVFDLATLVVAVPTPGATVLPQGVRSPLFLRARGRVQQEAGWRAVDPPGASRDVDLPRVEVGDAAAVAEVNARAGETKPPRPMDDAALLLAMENAGRDLDEKELARAMRHSGLGTPATRAAVLQTLLDRGYVVRKGRELRVTEKGFALLDTCPVEDLKSAVITGRWEQRLARIAEGREARGAFMADVGGYVQGIVDAIRGATLPAAALVREREQGPSLGVCPRCGQPVRKRGTVFTCDTGRGCPFVVFGTMAKKAIGVKLVKELLKHGTTSVVEGFTSKAGKPFSAAITVGEDGKATFVFPDRTSTGPTDAPPPAPTATIATTTPEGMACPQCRRGTLLAGRTAWGCSRWKEGCGLRVAFPQPGGPSLAEIVASLKPPTPTGRR